MPGGSTIQQFVNDLRDRKSNITRALDELFGENPGRHKTSTAVATVVAWLHNPGSSPYKLIPDARTILRGLGLSLLELDHIDDWPPGQKKKVMVRLVDAIDHDNPYHFYWELHGGNKEDTVVPPLGGGDIIFRSPRSKVKVLTALTGEVTVDVG